jgi:hypothetical protein
MRTGFLVQMELEVSVNVNHLHPRMTLDSYDRHMSSRSHYHIVGHPWMFFCRLLMDMIPVSVVLLQPGT